MKKIYSCILFCMLAVAASAQITITQADIAGIGTTVVESHDTTTIVSPGSSGTNQTWDFSSLNNNGSDTLSFVSPTGMPCSTDYPGANMAANSFDGTVFLNSSSSSLQILGFCDTMMGGPYKFMPYWTLITFPSSYQTAYNETYKNRVEFSFPFPPVDSIRVISTTDASSNIDGWGTVKTPFGGPVNCLRQIHTEYSTDSTYTHDTITKQWAFQPPATMDTSITYRWWTSNGKFPMAEIVTDAAGNVTEKSFLSAVMTGIEQKEYFAGESVSVYPNPATAELNIRLNSFQSAPISIAVFNMVGQEQIKETMTNASGGFKINTADASNGMYFFILKNVKGEVLYKGKFVVAN